MFNWIYFTDYYIEYTTCMLTYEKCCILKEWKKNRLKALVVLYKTFMYFCFKENETTCIRGWKIKLFYRAEEFADCRRSREKNCFPFEGYKEEHWVNNFIQTAPPSSQSTQRESTWIRWDTDGTALYIPRPRLIYKKSASSYFPFQVIRFMGEMLYI